MFRFFRELVDAIVATIAPEEETEEDQRSEWEIQAEEDSEFYRDHGAMDSREEIHESNHSWNQRRAH